MTSRQLPPPDIDWLDDGTPRDQRTGDIYYQAGKGLAEARATFVEGVGGAELWRGKPRIRIGETGFGTGLNFLATWAALDESGYTGRLDYLSVEAFPPTPDQLARAHSPYDLGRRADALRAAWPSPRPGFHYLRLAEGRIGLTLLFGLAEEALAEAEGRMDGWYLDGFAPQVNPDLWTPDLFRHIAQLSAPGARVATFTAAGVVKRGLAEAGFAVTKVPGFGGKRESIRATFEGTLSAPRMKEPWLAPPPPAPDGPVCIIGAGIAGASVARALADRGADVLVLEAGGSPGHRASGNPVGLLEPRLLLSANADAALHLQAFDVACRTYGSLADSPLRAPRGMIHLALNENEAERQARLVADLPGLQLLDAKAVRERAGIAVDVGGLLIEGAGPVSPPTAVRSLLGGTALRLHSPVTAITPSGGGWTLTLADGETIRSGAVVLTDGAAGGNLWPGAPLPIRPNRGQVSLFDAPDPSPEIALGFGGYLAPVQCTASGRRYLLTGATYDDWPDDSLAARDVRTADHDRNRRNLAAALPELAANLGQKPFAGRADLRATTPDRLPIMGGGFDGALFEKRFDKRLRGARPGASEVEGLPFAPGLYHLTGLGSRGLLTAPLLGEALAARIMDTPLPVSNAVERRLHPARFLARQIRRS
ncbi:MAG: bifunctional tRNA (5-methylaminomethyl-2-thiouridine)(34)-methyltransferase MnmD/FAD-dependent 5-carboxymethylaminomethyl-2-thiouridine(34) oxidoreductase MnmC [Magnetovibrionaceae bacterium]